MNPIKSITIIMFALASSLFGGESNCRKHMDNSIFLVEKFSNSIVDREDLSLSIGRKTLAELDTAISMCKNDDVTKLFNGMKSDISKEIEKIEYRFQLAYDAIDGRDFPLTQALGLVFNCMQLSEIKSEHPECVKKEIDKIFKTRTSTTM